MESLERQIVQRKNRRSRLRKTAIFLAVLLAITGLMVAWMGSGMRSAVEALAVTRIRSVTARAMNDAILDTMGGEEKYQSLVTVRENGNKVYLLQADTRQMNLLAAECAEAAQERIAIMGEQGVSVPLGTTTGIALFSGKGPRIRISFTPAGSVQSEFNSEFISSGINQTLYRVKLRLTATVQLVIPGLFQSVSVVTEAAIAESIIVGEVPQVYTDVANNDDMLNLIPTEVP